MIISLATLDSRIITPDMLVTNLHLAHTNNASEITIDLLPEGSCAEKLKLYSILDKFCLDTGYAKNRIVIKTANMLEHHAEYRIEKHASGWYEIDSIQQWLKDKQILIGYSPKYHFANFSSRTNWFRLWIATILDVHHKDKTIQTYHYDPERDNYNPLNETGLEELQERGCEVLDSAKAFIKTCPRTLDIEFLKDLTNTKGSVFQHNSSYYPIQHPSNLNLLQYYNDIFVDIVAEPNACGDCFLVTEKLWRPIIARRPFIVMSNRKYLDNLRKLGFKTFDKIWSEEYDNYAENDRIKSIEKLLYTIASWKDLDKKLLEMQDILDHNYLTFKNLKPESLKKVFGAV